MNNPNSETRNMALIFFSYVLSMSVMSFSHEFWRDELQCFMLVENSNSIAELIHNIRYEGHPSLWFLILFGLKFIAPGLLPIKIAHLSITAFSGWIIIKYSPFETIQKALILAGYFFFYEYAFIVRNYAIGILFIVAFCAVFPQRESPKYFFLLAGFIVGMMMSNIYSFFIGAGLMALMLAEHVFYLSAKDRMWKFAPGYLLMLGGAMLFVLDVVPPADYGYANSWNIHFRVGEIAAVFSRIAQVFIPIPILQVQYWNTVIIDNLIVQAFLGIIIILLTWFVFARKKLSRWFIVFTWMMLLGFSYVKFNGYLRHNGHLFIAFIVMMWLQEYLPGEKREAHKYSGKLFYLMLVIQCVAMLGVVSMEKRYTFSQSKNTAEYIQKNYPNALIVAHEDAGSSSVCAFLKKPFYYPASDRFGTYIVWNKKRLESLITTNIILHKGDSLQGQYKKEILYLSTSPIDSTSKYGLVLQKKFTPSIEPMESYYLYTK